VPSTSTRASATHADEPSEGETPKPGPWASGGPALNIILALAPLEGGRGGCVSLPGKGNFGGEGSGTRLPWSSSTKTPGFLLIEAGGKGSSRGAASPGGGLASPSDKGLGKAMSTPSSPSQSCADAEHVEDCAMTSFAGMSIGLTGMGQSVWNLSKPSPSKDQNVMAPKRACQTWPRRAW